MTQKLTCGRLRERRSMSADAHGKPMFGAFAHFFAHLWTSANTFRRSLALSLTRMPMRAGDHGRVTSCTRTRTTCTNACDPVTACRDTRKKHFCTTHPLPCKGIVALEKPRAKRADFSNSTTAFRVDIPASGHWRPGLKRRAGRPRSPCVPHATASRAR